MSRCTCENWTLNDLASALQDRHKDNKHIVVPMFQRGARWTKTQERVFIDSLIKGYPVGTLLFYETFEDNKRTYILVDGLQRGNSIKKYMNNPTEFFYDDSISDQMCHDILVALEQSDISFYKPVRDILVEFIRSNRSFKNLQYYSVAKKLVDYYKTEMRHDFDPISRLIEIISVFFQERQDLYDTLANTQIPVIVYSGDESNLPEIFDRINSKGTPLDKYEVYAAAWPINDKFFVNNNEIIEFVIKKYETLMKDGYEIHGFSKEALRIDHKLNAFEYLFGLGRYLAKKYHNLAFQLNLKDDEVNTLAFELVDACLNDSNNIKSLYKSLKDVDINVFESNIEKAVEFVNLSINPIARFKGNNRAENKIFHAKFQILSMISTTYREMFDSPNSAVVSEGWVQKKIALAKNLMRYYVYDILSNYWGEGGTVKIYSAAKPNRYLKEISAPEWMAVLNGVFAKSMTRSERYQIANPKKEDLVILNCIYLKTFSAMDQLNIDKFDVEHIAPKEQMKRLLNSCDGAGLPISSIANLCYLPEYVNRGKRDRNFYQDKKYLEKVNLEEVETKYSFTEREDLEWMDMLYEKPEDYALLKECYTDFCTARFEKMKKLICEALDIEYIKTTTQQNVSESANSDESIVLVQPELTFPERCVKRFVEETNTSLVRKKRSIYSDSEGENSYFFSTSKLYVQGNREKYWFAYRRVALMDESKTQFYVFGCQNEKNLIKIPVSLIEENIEALNPSHDDDGNVTHWHIVIFKDKDGRFRWMLSRPSIREIDVTEYAI